MDYSLFYKEDYHYNVEESFPVEDKWDIFISSFNLNEKITNIFEEVSAKKKYWLIHPEYNFDSSELPLEGTNKFVISSKSNDEAEIILNLMEIVKENIEDLNKKNICIDISGFLAPSLLFLLYYFKAINVNKFDVIYSAPVQYIEKEETVFYNNFKKVRQIRGFEGEHVTSTEKDVLIIGTGYDYRLIAQVAEYKERAQKYKIFGFPSLGADMYQENILRAQSASESIGETTDDTTCFFSPANDPFVTATVLNEIFENLKREKDFTNIYLSPVGTKAQALGFALFYLKECNNMPVSIIFPFCQGYTKKTSVGLSRIWKYTIEFN